MGDLNDSAADVSKPANPKWKRVRTTSEVTTHFLSKSRKSIDDGNPANAGKSLLDVGNFVTNQFEITKRSLASAKRTRQLAGFVPDFILNGEDQRIPFRTSSDAVTFMADVSGFTKLTELYSLKGKGGTDQLTKTLSSYMGPLAECILRANGDIIKYAGDAFLAVWKVPDLRTYAQEIQRATDCALYIQEKHGSLYCADVDITIRVKIGIGAGRIHQCTIGNQDYQHFVCFGPGVESCSNAEKNCESGEVIMEEACWDLVDSNHFSYAVKDEGYHRIIDITHFLNPDHRGRPVANPRRTVLGPTKAVQNLNEPGIAIRPVMFTAIEKKSELQLRHFVIPPVLKKMDDDVPLEYLNESRITSICFIKIDLKEFDEATIESGEAMMNTVNTAFKYIYKNCTVLQGCLSKVIMFDKGLTYLVIFGLPGYIHDNQSNHALKFAHRVKSLLHSIKNVTEVSLGITSGQTYCGVLGHYLRQEYTLMGPSVNKAARLMCYYPGRVTCDQDTLYHSKLPVHHFSLMEAKQLKGIKTAGSIYEYLGAESGEEQSVKTFDYPMVGRDAELDYFKKVLDQVHTEHERYVQLHIQADLDLKNAKDVSASSLWILVYEGDVGIGKSRLLAACIQESLERKLITFSVEMNALLASHRMYAIQSLLQQAFGIDEMRSSQEREEHIRKVVGGDTEIASGLCLLNDLFQLKFPMHSKYTGADITTRHGLAQHAIVVLLRHFYPKELVVFVIDDAHLVDETSWEYLQYLSKSPTIFTLASLRRNISGAPRLSETISKILFHNKNVRSVRLAGIETMYSLIIACQVMEVGSIPVELEKIIVNKSQGIPSWIDQVLKEMIRNGLLKVVGKDGGIVRSRNLKMSEVDIQFITPIIKAKKRSTRKKLFDYVADDDEMLAYPTKSKSEGHMPSNSQIQLPIRVQKELIRPEVRMCIVKSNTNIGAAPIPGSLKEILLDAFDELESNEQTLLKCASVLGVRFSRAMLIRIVPTYEVNSRKYDFGFRHLMESGVLQCASRRTGQATIPDGDTSTTDLVECFCRFTKSDDKSKDSNRDDTMEQPSTTTLTSGKSKKPKYYKCKFMAFAKENMVEVIYELMTEDQRKELHLKSAKYLDTSTVSCRLHGGEPSEYQFGFQLKGTDLGGDNEEALRNAAMYSRKKRSSAKRGVAAAAVNKVLIEQRDLKTRSKRGSLAARIDGLKKFYQTGGSKIGDIEVDILKGLDDLEDKTKAHKKNNSVMRCCFSSKNTDDDAKEWEFTAAEVKKLDPKNVGTVEGGAEPIGEGGDSSLKKTKSDTTVFSGEGEGDRGRSSTIDFRGCECASLQARVCVEMVKHYRKAEKYGKCLTNLLDAAESSIATGNSGQSLVHLEDAIALLHAIKEKELPEPDENDGDDSKIDHDKVTIDIEFLNGLSYFELGVQHKARDNFCKALSRLDLKVPGEDDRIGRDASIMRATSALWRRHTFTCCVSKKEFSEKDKKKLNDLNMKLRILAYLHKLFRNERRPELALLVALWQTIAAEDIGGSFLDLIPAYCSLMETYSLISNHKKAEYYENLALELIRDTFGSAKQQEMMGLLTCANLFYTISSIRLVRGDISSATESSYLSLRIAQAINDNTLSIHVLPMVIQSLLFSLRISEMIEALQKLWYISEEEEDWGGVAIYYTLCLDLLLNTAYPLEPFCTCENFVNNSNWNGDIQMFREYEVQYNMEASLALWYCRYSRWEGAQRWKALAESHRPKVTTFLSVSAELKLLECNLIMVSHFLEGKRFQHFAKARNSAKELMRILKKSTKVVPIFLPRFQHLMGYYCRIRSRNAESDRYLRKAENGAERHANNLETEWIKHNHKVWTENAIPTLKFFWLEHTENHSLDWHQSGRVPWTNIMFSLPLPSWKS